MSIHHLYKFEVMTSPCEVHLYHLDPIKARDTASHILKMAKGLEKKYNFYNKDSFLSSLNQREENILDPQTKQLLQRAKLFYTQTHGIFDITMGTLVEARKRTSLNAIKEETQKLKAFTGVEHFEIKRNKIIWSNPHTKIDLGGFVKEFAVDEAIKILKKAKIKSALVNFGGDIYALGVKPNQAPFSIGIKNPLNPKEYIYEVKIKNQALTTSASYERNHKIEDETFSHIIGQKITLQKEILSTTIIASNTVEAGVFSTSLMIDPTLKTSLQKILISKGLEVL